MRSTHNNGRIANEPRKTGEFFRSLSPSGLRELKAIVLPISCPARAILFQEEQPPASILILLEGSVKISVNSSDGRRMILRIAKPAELLGLTSVLSGTSHEVTAEALHPCRIASIPRKTFLDFLTRHPATYQSLARELGREMSHACEQMRIIGLSSSAVVRLARLFLVWSADDRRPSGEICLSVPLTHGELGECIGVTRETASRAMIELRQRRLIEVRGTMIHVADRRTLQFFADQADPVVSPSVRSPNDRRSIYLLQFARLRAEREAGARLRQA